MGRDRTGPLLLFGLLAACGGLVWLMYHPDWPLLEKAQALPLVGPHIARFREYYTPPEMIRPPAADESRGSTVEIVLEPPRTVDAGPRLWVQRGTAVRAVPASTGELIGRVESLSNPRWTESRGDWYRIESRGSRPSDDIVGWVLVDEPASSFPTRPPTVEPAGPLTASAISSTVLNTAKRLMGSDAGAGTCGPYGLLTDVVDPGLGTLCEELVTRIDGAFARQYRREPIGSPAETLLVFAEERDFRIFAGSTSRWKVEAEGRASAAEGYVALAWEARERDELAQTMVHELSHLVNRRALGPALPPWLEEGMAEELADRLVGGKLPAATWQVQMDRTSGDLLPLAEFVELGPGDFYGERGYSSYAQALVLVRYLSGHPQLEAGFQSFLDSLAVGGSYTPEVLRRHLGRSWDDLQQNWDAWGRGHHQAFPPFAEILAGD